MKDFFMRNWATILILLVFAGWVFYLVVNKKWDELRGTAYKLIIQAEKVITGTKKGRERFETVFKQVYSLIPPWLRFFFPEESVREKLQEWFVHLKDYLSDGKLDGNECNISPII